MDEQLQEVMVEGGEEILGWLRTSGEFAAEQAPLLAQEIVRYGVWNNGLQIAFFVVTVPTLLYTAYRLGTGKDVWETDPTPKAIVCIATGGIGAILGVAGMVICSSDAVPNLCKALVAPRLYIIEQIARLVG